MGRGTQVGKHRSAVHKSWNKQISVRVYFVYVWWYILFSLLDDGVCSEKNIPSISSINRIIRDKSLVRRRGFEIYIDANGQEEVAANGGVFGMSLETDWLIDWLICGLIGSLGIISWPCITLHYMSFVGIQLDPWFLVNFFIHQSQSRHFLCLCSLLILCCLQSSPVIVTLMELLKLCFIWKKHPATYN